MWGANDPCCRKPMVWDDCEYEDEAILPNGERRAVAERVAVDRELFEYYRKLIHIRRDHVALQLGDFETLLLDEARELYAFSRSYENQRIVVLINNSNTNRHVKNLKTGNSEFVDLFDEHIVVANNEDEMDCEVQALSGRIFRRR